MEKLKNQLAGIAALVGVLGAIGAGFVTYGEMQDQNVKIEKQNNKIAVLEKTIQVLELNIQELKASGRNPLAN
jgi:cell division protein FtsB